VPNCKPFLVTEAERKHIRTRARFQRHVYASYHQVSPPPLQDKAQKEIHAFLTEILREHSPSYTTIKNWDVQYKRDDFSTCDAPHPGRPNTVSTPEIIVQIQELILVDRRSLSKSIPEKQGISRERVGSIIHEDLDMRMFSAKWVPKCLNAEQKCQRRHSSDIWNFSARSRFPVAIGDHGRNLVISRRNGDKATTSGMAA